MSQARIGQKWIQVTTSEAKNDYKWLQVTASGGYMSEEEGHRVNACDDKWGYKWLRVKLELQVNLSQARINKTLLLIFNIVLFYSIQIFL